ncbi:MAG: PAS domain S-box protein [Deltaproteobacteria bacterium]|nr:PAS domain S-box protein [Deltaproteobacteria bacterium]
MFASLKKPAVVMGAALLAYAGIFYLMHAFVGRGMTIVSVIPVVAAAWCFGRFWGTAAALLSFAANSALCIAFGIDWQEHVVLRGALIPGTAALIGIALMVGYMRALRARLQRTISDLSSEVVERRSAEEQLRELMQFSDNVIESSIDSIVVGDVRGTIVRVNRALLDMSGYSREELIGQSPLVLSYIAPGDYLSITGEAISIDDGYMLNARAQHEKLFETGRILDWQYYIVRKDARLVPAEGNIVLLRDDAGEAVGSLAIIRDISARRVIEQELDRHRAHLHDMVQAKAGQLLAREQELRAANQQLVAANEQLQAANRQLRSGEQALRESEERFRAVVQLANEAIVIIDAQGSIIFWNQGAEKIYGYSADEILKQPVLVLVPEANRALHGNMIATMNARDDMPGMQATSEGLGRRKNGDTFPLEFSITRWETSGTKLYGFIVRDTTDRKKAEAELVALSEQQREAREFLENVFRTTNDGIVISDTDGKIIRVNSTIEKMLGYAEQEIIGRSALDFFSGDGDYRRQGLEMVAELRRTGSVQNWETEWCRKDGTHLPVEINVTFLRDRDGNATGAVAAVRDITERRGIEQRLLQTEKLKSLGEMASGVAHDFNNVLTAILGRAQLLKRMIGGALQQAGAARPAEIEKGLSVIESAALDGAETVRRIQDFSRAGTSQRFSVSVDLAEVIGGALDYTRVRWKDDAELKGLRYRIENTVSVPVPVVGNAAELREVFTNLINNSLDAMPQGGTLYFAAACDETTATVTVQDTGIGIAPSIIDRIFDPFFTTKGPRSTGLGMSVSYGIIRRHKGSISAASEEGRGTTLKVALPLGRLQERVRSDVVPAGHGAGLRVLVIDDDADVRDVLADMLSGDGHRVARAADGPEGLELFRAEPFDLVFTDLGMPGMSGWVVAREVKRIHARVLVAMVTGWDVHYEQENIEKYRIDFVLNKPFQVSHIMDVVHMARRRLEGKY